MKKKLFFSVFIGCLSLLYSCSQFVRSDPDLLYSCIDSSPIGINKSDKGPGDELGDKQLEAIEFCLKRS
ncbi:MAG: hypothetical protein CMK57_02390 [Proteobacteria bacterium]|nr:hypothetical protein [Pseudomonadota bacterium]